MARKRVIDPEFWLDEQLAGGDMEIRLFYIGTWNFADDYGVIEYSPMKLKAQIFPYDPIDPNKCIDELVRMGKLVPFEAEGKKWLYIKKFLKWQRVEKPSKLRNPEAPKEIVGEDSPTTPQPVGDEVKRSEVKLSKENITPLQLFEKFKSNPLWEKLVQKYPDRDYEYIFSEMCDWYQTKKKRLPQNISAFSNWLSKTRPDPDLVAERVERNKKKEAEKKKQELESIPQAKPETLNKLKQDMAKFKAGVKTI